MLVVPAAPLAVVVVFVVAPAVVAVSVPVLVAVLVSLVGVPAPLWSWNSTPSVDSAISKA